MLSLFTLWRENTHQMVWTFSVFKENALDSPCNKGNKETRKHHEQSVSPLAPDASRVRPRAIRHV